MKLTALISAVIILMLSIMPCMDGVVARDTCKESTEQSGRHDEESSEDACSPFCVCSCCASPIYSFVSRITITDVIIPDGPKVFSSLYIGSITEISLPIWQPPQLRA